MCDMEARDLARQLSSGQRKRSESGVSITVILQHTILEFSQRIQTCDC